MLCHLFVIYLVPPPRIIEHPTNTTVPVTQTAVLVCVGQGYGFVDVSWHRTIKSNEQSIPSKSIVTTMVSSDDITTIISSLTIPDLADSHRGSYWCVYSNNGGETHSGIAELATRSKPLLYDILLIFTLLHTYISSSS